MEKSAVEKRNPKLLKRILTKMKFEIRNLKVNIFLNQVIFTIKQNINKYLLKNLLKKILFYNLMYSFRKARIIKRIKRYC